MVTAKLPVADILASAFSQMLDTPVLTYEEFERKKGSAETQFFSPLDVDTMFRLSYQMGTDETSSVSAQETANPSLHCSCQTVKADEASSISGQATENPFFSAFVKIPSGNTLTFIIDKHSKTQSLKEISSDKLVLHVRWFMLVGNLKTMSPSLLMESMVEQPYLCYYGLWVEMGRKRFRPNSSTLQ